MDGAVTAATMFATITHTYNDDRRYAHAAT